MLPDIFKPTFGSRTYFVFQKLWAVGEGFWQILIFQNHGRQIYQFGELIQFFQRIGKSFFAQVCRGCSLLCEKCALPGWWLSYEVTAVLCSKTLVVMFNFLLLVIMELLRPFISSFRCVLINFLLHENCQIVVMLMFTIGFQISSGIFNSSCLFGDGNINQIYLMGWGSVHTRSSPQSSVGPGAGATTRQN